MRWKTVNQPRKLVEISTRHQTKSLWKICLELHLQYLFRCRWCPPASNYLTVLPIETEFDSKAQAVVHGSDDAVTEPDSTTFEAIEGMAVFDSETQSFWVAPRPKDKSGVVYDELSDTDKTKFDASRFKEIDNLLKLNALSVMSPEESDHFAKTTN